VKFLTAQHKQKQLNKWMVTTKMPPLTQETCLLDPELNQMLPSLLISRTIHRGVPC